MGSQKGEAEKEILLLREKESQTLSKKIWIKNRYVQNRLKNIERLLHTPDISKILTETIIDNQPYSLPVMRLETILKGKKISMIKKPFIGLLRKLRELQDLYGIELSIVKLANDKFETKPNCIIPKYLSYKIEGHTLSNLSSSENTLKFLNRTIQLKCLINEIEINDATSSSQARRSESQFLEVFSEMEDRISPTIIKYNFHDVIKSLLVYIPSGLSVSKLMKAYGTKLAKIQEDFYSRKFRGTPCGRQSRGSQK